MTTEREYKVLKEKARAAHATIKHLKSTELLYRLIPESDLLKPRVPDFYLDDDEWL